MKTRTISDNPSHSCCRKTQIGPVLACLELIFSRTLFVAVVVFSSVLTIANRTDAVVQSSESGNQGSEAGQEELPPAGTVEAHKILTSGLADSLRFASMGDHRRAIQTLEELNRNYPGTDRVEFMLLKRLDAGSASLNGANQRDEKLQLYLRTAQLAKELLPKVPEDQKSNYKSRYASSIYNEACALASNGQQQECLKSLGLAIDWGFNDMRHLMNDPDLASVTDGPELETLIGEPLKQYRADLRARLINDLKGFPAVDFELEMPDLNNQLHKLSDFQGNVIFVTFFNSTSGQARRNVNALARLHRNYEDKNVTVIGVGCEKIRDPAKVAAKLESFLTTNPIPYLCLVSPLRARLRLQRVYGFPVTLVINRQGKLQAVFPRQTQYMSLATVADVLLQPNWKDLPTGQESVDQGSGSAARGSGSASKGSGSSTKGSASDSGNPFGPVGSGQGSGSESKESGSADGRSGSNSNGSAASSKGNPLGNAEQAGSTKGNGSAEKKSGSETKGSGSKTQNSGTSQPGSGNR